MIGPLLTSSVADQLRLAIRAGAASVECSLDLGRSRTAVDLDGARWQWNGQRFPVPIGCKERTIYHWSEGTFQPVARYTTALIKLVPTSWGPPTFEIDGIKMLPTARVSPCNDAARKVALIRPRGKRILDTCGGLGYFAACCLEGGAARVLSFEKNADVIWLRGLNPWSPLPDARLEFAQADITTRVSALPDKSVDAILHDPPRFGIAGELYSGAFYLELARVITRGGRLFHYTGTPNKQSRGRDLASEVAVRLRNAGFTTTADTDGVVAVRT